MTNETETTPRDLSLDELDAIAAGETRPAPPATATCGLAYRPLTVGSVYTITFQGSLGG